MKTIYKYPLRVVDEQHIKMPLGAKILSIQVQGDEVCLWAEVDTDAPIGDRFVTCYGTGHQIWADWQTYVASVQQGLFVWHFYDGGYAV